jgi:hypothetical protein
MLEGNATAAVGERFSMTRIQNFLETSELCPNILFSHSHVHFMDANSFHL